MLKLIFCKTWRDQDGELVSAEPVNDSFTPREIIEHLRNTNFLATLSVHPVDLSQGQDVTNIHVTDYSVGEGTRESIEQGWSCEISIHYVRDQPSQNKKYWRYILRFLSANKQIIH